MRTHCLWCKNEEGAPHLEWCPRYQPPAPPEPELVLLDTTDLPFVYRWTRDGRHKHPCRVVKRVRNECLIEFADGHRFTTDRRSLRKNKQG